MSRFGFAFNPTNSQARAALERARAWCAANGVDAWDAEADDRERIAAECVGSDLVCVLGGDERRAVIEADESNANAFAERVSNWLVVCRQSGHCQPS